MCHVHWKIEKTMGGVYGQVIDKKKNPLSNVKIKVDDKETITSGDGMFRIPNILPGTYQYLVYSNNTIFTSGNIHIFNGTDVLLEIQLNYK